MSFVLVFFFSIKIHNYTLRAIETLPNSIILNAYTKVWKTNLINHTSRVESVHVLQFKN